ncbi:MAG TPA: hypothetical protein RMF84_02120 [Polyangiaceae bacterium LLY-WYZ-14_1]|jgi:hypothetical protein|nr:hypothetical protein [Polyangiaceae bacterium LLY-WYZ-14_1]
MTAQPSLDHGMLEAVLLERARVEMASGRLDLAQETLRVAAVLLPDAPAPVRALSELLARRGQTLRSRGLREIADRLESALAGGPS